MVPMKEAKVTTELSKLIKHYTQDTWERRLLTTILKAGGSIPRISLFNQFVPDSISRRTFYRKTRSLLDHHMIARTLGERKGRAVIVYELGPALKPDLLHIVDQQLLKLALRASRDIEVKAKTDEQRRKVLEEAVKDTLTLQRYLTLRAISSTLEEKEDEKAVRIFHSLMDLTSTQAVADITALCHVYPELAKPLIDHLVDEVGKEKIKILKPVFKSKKPPSKGRR